MSKPGKAFSRLDDSGAAIAAFVILCALVGLPGLGSAGLMNMEAMVALSAEEMLRSGDHLVPRLYGEIYTYKPPLAYWLAEAALLSPLPIEWSFRLPGVMAATFMGIVVLVLTARMTSWRSGFFAGAASLTGILFIQKIRWAEFDTLLSAACGVAIAAACYQLALPRARRSPLGWTLCYAALAAGFFVKGLPALMVFGPGLLAAALVTGHVRALFRWDHLLAVAASGLLASAYLWFLWRAVGADALAQPLEEAGRRGFAWSSDAILMTFLKPLVILLVFLPWSALWPAGLARLKAARTRLSPRDSYLLAAAAFLMAGVAVFVLVPTHETRYYLPLAAPGAIVSAFALDELSPASRRARRIATAAAVVCGALIGGIALSSEFSDLSRWSLGVIGLMVVLLAWIASRFAARHAVAVLLLIIALGLAAAEATAFRPRRAQTRDLRAPAAEIGAVLGRDETVWILADPTLQGDYAPLHFYLARPVRTFSGGIDLPPAGARVLLAVSELESLEEIDPGAIARLRPVSATSHPAGDLHLFVVE